MGVGSDPLYIYIYIKFEYSNFLPADRIHT